jgi:hypothetical protein
MPQAARRRDGAASLLKRIPISRAAAVLAAAVVWVSAAEAAGTRAAPAHACDLYRELDRRCGCAGADDYFRGYGEKYCERFMRSTGWSAAGLRWRAQTLACLKDDLRHFLKRASGCSCASVKAFAFDSHARCYTRKPSSVCRLPLSDIAHIYALVDAPDLIAPLGSRQTLAITLACVWQNGDAGARPDLPSR